MVAAISTTASTPRIPRNPSTLNRRDDLLNPIRPLLVPSEKDNAAAVSRRSRTKEITSRYLSSSSTTTFSSSSFSSSTTTTTTTTKTTNRRFPSPVSKTPSTLPQPSLPKRSHSVSRIRPATETSSAAGTLSTTTTTTTTRSLAVSFQGESFSFQTSKAKPISPKPTPERRKPNSSAATPLRSSSNRSENSKPFDNHRRWPTAKTQQSNSLTRSLDCSLEKKDQIMVAVRLLRNSMVFDEGVKRASFDGEDLSLSSDTDSLSSGSNSGSQEPNFSLRGRATPQGISVPARFWAEANSQAKKLSLVDNQLLSPRTVSSSPLCKPIRPSSPSKASASPLNRMASPSRVRSGTSQPSNAPSILSFAAEARRAKKGESRIEEAHSLRLFYNRYLQWRCVNARADAALSAQILNAEKNLYNACITTSEMRDSVTIKRIKLQLLIQHLKLTSILKGQLTYLEEWSLMDRDHLNSLSGVTEALKASTLRLPVVGGARADIQEVQNAVGSAVDVMQAMGSSICSLLSKLQGMSSLVSELGKAAAHERALLYQSRDLLSTVATMHVRQCSLQGHIFQLNRKLSLVQL